MRITLHILLFMLCIPFIGYTQDRAACKSIVEQFYAMLYKDAVTIQQFGSVYDRADAHNDATTFLEDSLQNPYTVPLGFGLKQIKREARVNPDTTASYVFKKVKKYFPVLTQGLSFPEIKKVIETGKMYEEGDFLTKYFEITFHNGDYVCCELSEETPLSIQDIWLPNALSLNSLIGDFAYEFKRPGIIKDPDGYVNVREKADKNAAIISIVKQNELFYYTPTNISDWWLIYKEDTFREIGYIHKSKILKYKDFPPKLKRKVDQQRGGC